jgi:hypothetical protein
MMDINADILCGGCNLWYIGNWKRFNYGGGAVSISLYILGKKTFIGNRIQSEILVEKKSAA